MDPLVSPDELRTYLQRDLDEDVAALAVASASGIVRDFCRWPISTEEVTFTLDGSGTTMLNLPTLRLVSVDAVRIDGTEIAAAVPTVSDGYTWSERGQVYLAAGWPARLRCIEVDCVHGYDSTPDTVRAVVLVLAVRAATNPEGLRSKTIGGISKSFVFETMRGDLSELQMAQIGGYRLP